MPKLFGLNLLGVLLAAVAFYVVGMIWYGFAFSDLWQSAVGVSKADYEGSNPAWMAGGVVIALLAAIGIGKVLQWRNITTMGAAMMTAFMLWVFFALGFVAYDLVYLPGHSTTLFLIDASHLLVGWLAAAGVLTLVK